MSTTAQASTNVMRSGIIEADVPVAQDFLLFCPLAASANEVMNAIHALYYLPDHYKLVVMKNASIIDGRKMSEGNEDLMDRILFETDTRAPGETPSYSYADAVICSDNVADIAPVNAPHIVISDLVDNTIECRGANSFTVPADSPEALASAAIRIAQTGLFTTA